MAYYTGSIVAVPTAKKQEYIEHLAAAWQLMRNHGAVRIVESWGVDVPRGKVNDLHGAVDAREDETIAFGWMEWPDKESADNAWQQMQSDPAMQQMPPPPFDGGRMIFGGFQPLFTQGSDRDAGYIQGFVLAVPEDSKSAYADMARQAWAEGFEPHGCLGTVEAWGIDVPHGKRTDFHRATKAETGEVTVFAWCAWPDKATCDAAHKAMETEMEGKEFPEMPFDGMRMMWGGFQPIFDSAKQ